MRKLLFISLLAIFNTVIAQDSVFINKYYDTLQVLARQIRTSKDDFVKFNANETFKVIMKEALQFTSANTAFYDSLKLATYLRADDNMLSLVTWMLPKSDGTFEYFGIVKSYNYKKKRFHYYELIDKSEEIANPERETMSYDYWYGALYYKIITNKYKGKKYYTLLGWDGANILTNKKVIDVITVSSSGFPRFGASIFKINRTTNKRVIFEYSENTSMSVKYEKQWLDIQAKDEKFVRQIKKNKKSNAAINRKKTKRDLAQKQKLDKKREAQKKELTKKKTKKVRLDQNNPANMDVPRKKRVMMIVFDRLVPLDPSLAGQYQYYIPETNIFDAFVFSKGKWIFAQDVDARNFPRAIAPKKKKISYTLLPD